MDVELDDAISAAVRMDPAFLLRLAYPILGGLGEFQANWHHDAYFHALDRVAAGETRRLIITAPPRHLKSVCATTIWPAWMLGTNPALQIMCLSYGQELADDHARNSLKVMMMPEYRRAFPSLVLSRQATSDFGTSAGGRRFSTSLDGLATGFGCDIMIIDDPMKGQDAMSPVIRQKTVDTFSNTLEERLTNQETGAIVIVAQRLHQADLIGELKERGGWEELCLPAIAPRDQIVPLTRKRFYRRRAGHPLHAARMSLETLNRKKAAKPYVYAAQYDQDPVPPDGNLFEKHWFNYYFPEELPEYGTVVQAWDCANKDNPGNDFSVCITARIAQNRTYLLDVFRRRLKFPELLATAKSLARTHSADVMLVEDQASGQALIQALRNETNPGVPFPLALPTSTDKYTRALGATGMIAAGKLYLPKHAHWQVEFMQEVLGFPGTRHDDQVDALAHLLNWVIRSFQEPSTLEGPIGVDDPGFDSDDDYEPGAGWFDD